MQNVTQGQLRFPFLMAAMATLALLAGCGGGGSSTDNGTSSNSGNNTGNTYANSGRMLLLDPTRSNAETPISGLQYDVAGNTSGADGSFNTANGSLSLLLGSNTRLALAAKTTLTQQDMASALCSGNADPTACAYNTSKNLEQYFLSMDSDRNSTNAIQLSPNAYNLNLQWTVSPDQFESALAQQLAAYGQTPAATFSPSLGINTEAPQSEQDSISTPIAFADIFRVARPFKEFSCVTTTYDEHGWPTSSPSSTCLVRTFLLDSAVKGSVPDGQYTVLYEGDGTLEYSGYVNKLVSRAPGRDVVDVTLPAKLDTSANAANRIALRVVSGTVKNIRIIMPGGICEGNPSVRVEDASGCPAGQFRSFEEALRNDRNAIVFNPDYLRFMKNFRVVRMMNMMGSSPSYLACAKPDPANPTNPNAFEKDASGNVVIDQDCLVSDLTWEQRSKMDDAVWGASGRVHRLERYARGTPIEVQVELANQLNAHPWFNIPHNATEYYNRQFAYYVATHLKPGLKAHIEYSNETWNGIFWAYHYMLKKGEDLGSPTDAWRGANYYAKQASKVFQWWEDEFGGTQRLVRLLGTYQNDANRTKRMLDYSDTRQYVDAIAMGGYFYACWDRALAACQDTSKVPKPLVEATSLDDIFAAMDNPNDPFGLEGVKSQFAKQAAVAQEYGKALYAYEGGQHLTIAGTIATDRRQNMIDLLHAANRDPRMGERYQQLLSSWKSAGGQTFMLFSVPHTFSQYGSFGIKENLAQPRTSAPKFDGAMKFQENVGQCWWGGC
ncbi:hypothetical protein [Thiothrix nivea]|uniref:Lipoprotein n=1 Tax=Thiothrix nivea (strain ATCC 35100 / DSM 5205 / JP2) TaxID=870187 RepID=A0A656HCJ5_THINJ|nr:hypothetical protein [Thiothrix nivea]EIJ33166.1 hypothetical protein Thini_0528 [Thiothrix nivea DSM 5205]